MAINFIQEDQYIGKQVLIDSDRLVFNGRDDSIFSSSNLFLFKTEGEFHVKRANKAFLAQKLGIKVEKLKAIELIQRCWRGYKGRKLAIVAHKEKNGRETMRLGLKSGLMH